MYKITPVMMQKGRSKVAKEMAYSVEPRIIIPEYNDGMMVSMIVSPMVSLKSMRVIGMAMNKNDSGPG
jgi:hypothetical protein